MNKMNYKEFFDLAKTKNINDIEVKETKKVTSSIETFDKKIEEFVVSNVTIYTITAIINKKLVKYTTENISDYQSIINKLLNNSKYIETTTTKNLNSFDNLKTKKIYPKSNLKAIRTNLLSISKYLIKPVEHINAYYSIEETKIKITNPISSVEDNHKYHSFYVEVITSDQKTATYSNLKRSVYKKINIDKITKETIKVATDKLKTKDFTSDNYQVLIKNNVMSEILDKFIPMFSANNIQKQTSLLKDKYNEKVFSSKLTIIEDPTNDNCVGKRLFDNEGTKTKYKTIIDKGKFTQKLYDKKTAEIDSITSTGNSYNEIGVRNLYIQNGTTKESDLIKQMKLGVIINDVQGGHAGINPTNGSISIQSEGYYVENGKIKHSIKLFVLVSSITELFNNIIDIGSDLEFNKETTNSPSILFNNVHITK